MNIIIPIGGKGERFLSNGYKEPKPLINILGKPMIRYVLDNLNLADDDNVFIIYYNIDTNLLKTVVKPRYHNVKLIKIDFQTKGAAETIYEGLKIIKSMKPTRTISVPIIKHNTMFNCRSSILYKLLYWYFYIF